MQQRKPEKNQSINEQVKSAAKKLLDTGMLNLPTDQMLIKEMMEKLDTPGTIFQADPETQRLIVDEVLGAASDQERLGALRDFLVSGEVRKQIKGAFDPGKFISDISDKIADLERKRKRLSQGPVGMPFPKGLLKQGRKGFDIEGLPEGLNRSKKIDYELEQQETLRLNLKAPKMPRGLHMEIEEELEAKVVYPKEAEEEIDLQAAIPKSPEAARQIRTGQAGRETDDKYTDDVQKSLAEADYERQKALYAERHLEARKLAMQKQAEETQRRRAAKKKKNFLSKLSNPVSIATGVSAGIGGVVGGLMAMGPIIN